MEITAEELKQLITDPVIQIYLKKDVEFIGLEDEAKTKQIKIEVIKE